MKRARILNSNIYLLQLNLEIQLQVFDTLHLRRERRCRQNRRPLSDHDEGACSIRTAGANTLQYDPLNPSENNRLSLSTTF